MPDQNNESTQPATTPEPPAPQKQLSSLAKWAFRLLVVGFILVIGRKPLVYVMRWQSEVLFLILCIVGIVLLLVAFILGILALVQIRHNKGNLKGMPRSLFTVVVSICCFLYIGNMLYTELEAVAHFICGERVAAVGKILSIYAEDHNDALPTASCWCDVVIGHEDVGVGQFICPGSDAIVGESSYAMNKYIADMNMSQLPKDIVVIFETDYGRTTKRGWWQKFPFSRDNKFYSVVESNGIPKVIRSDKLDKLRWNQVGGPEMLTCEHHQGKGCYILFGDGHVWFTKKEEFTKLRWKP
jgi:prepilin-type processing-associated H-X9-DG protein